MEVKLSGTPEEIVRILGDNDRQWICVKSRTPETAEPVIICRKSGGNFVTGVGTYRGGTWRVFDSSAKKVDFWRPLPPPPLTAPQNDEAALRGGGSK